MERASLSRLAKRSRGQRSSGRGALPPRSSRRIEPRGVAICAVHLAVLSAFAIAQPLFDLLSRQPEFFAARGSEGLDIIVFAVALTLVPPVALLLVELGGAWIHPRLMSVLHLLFVGGLGTAIAIQVLKATGRLPASALLLGALVLGVGVALVYSRAPAARSFLTVLSPAPLLFLALFVLFSPVAKLAFPSEAHARAASLPTQTPIVMVVFDEFPLTSLLNEANRIDPVRYPNFASFARDATWFRNATGAHDRTTKAVPAMLTGRLRREGVLPVASDYPDSLFTLFGDSYRMNVSEEATTLCPRGLCGDSGREQSFSRRMRSLTSDLALVYFHLVLPEAVSARLPSITDTWGDFRGDQALGDQTAGGESRRGAERRQVKRLGKRLVKGFRAGGRPARFEDWVSSIRSGPRPSLNFKHVFFPHVQWQYLPSGRQYRTEGGEPIAGLVTVLSETWSDEWLVEQAYQRHLLQVGFTDRLLGTLLDRLRTEGLYDRALVVLVADHGVSIRRKTQKRRVTQDNVEDIASVPLLIKAPHQRKPAVSDAYVRTVDLLPTIVDLLDVRLPWSTDGRSAFSKAVAGRRSVEMVQGSQAPVSRGGDRAVIRIDAPRFEVRQQAALERQIDLFGSGRDSLYRIGPNPDLLGKRTDELSVAPAAGLRATIDAPARLGSVDLGSSLVPSHLTGRIVGRGAGRKREIAIAVNGRIAAVAETFFVRGRAGENFSALVPESALRPGPNDVEVLAVSSLGARRRIQSLGETRPPGPGARPAP